MNKDIIKYKMNVNDNEISVIRIRKKEYISLTDLARYTDEILPIWVYVKN